MITAATLGDAEGLGHVQAWRETYPGIVPEAILAAQGPAERAVMWRRIIAAGTTVLVARDAAGGVLVRNSGPPRPPMRGTTLACSQNRP